MLAVCVLMKVIKINVALTGKLLSLFFKYKKGFNFQGVGDFQIKTHGNSGG